VKLPELIVQHDLGQFNVADGEAYLCAYINNLIEKKLA
jgi:hypothetical protein